MSRIQCRISLSEATFHEAKDGQPPIIRNVVLLGAESKNNRLYTAECMRRAVSLYEGVQGYVNHASLAEKEQGFRDVMSLAGQFTRPVFHESEMKIRADFEALPNDAAGAKFVNIARSMPNVAGLSHNAMATARSEGGKEIIESIDSVQSVDLVSCPATTNGMFEAENANDKGATEMLDYTQVTKLGLMESRKDLASELVQEGKNSRDAEIKELTEKNRALTESLDKHDVAENIRHKAELIGGLLTESKLPDEAVTDVFKESLNAVTGKDDAELKAKATALIEDRQAFIESVGNPGGVINSTEKANINESKGGGKTPVKAKITAAEAVTSLTGNVVA